ncbi:hypothetical protein HY635_00220 [Candidatus Uhrbacteria bacterium]|nr:hypothetical protein [Candidatus Uhrbacteria bacterium]
MAKRMEDLFQRPLSELRAAFVRARFAEEPVFGRPDIEEWLARERKADRPESDRDANESPWNAVLASDHMIFAADKRGLALLTELATPLIEMPMVLPVSGREREALAATEHLLAMIDRTRVDTYFGYTQGPILPILVTRPGGDHAIVCDLDAMTGSEVVLRLLDSGHVMDAIFAEWLYSRPRWREARQFLCDTLAEDIRKERANAELDFDMAVAVSADGTEIVHADYVVTSMRVLGANDRPFTPAEVHRVHAGDFFPDRKVLLCDPSQRTRQHIAAPSEHYDVGLAGILGACASGVPRQFIAEMADGKKILVTHPDLMPELAPMTPPWADTD